MMKDSTGQWKYTLLLAAAARLGIQPSRRKVVNAVCRYMALVKPVTKLAQYELLERFMAQPMGELWKNGPPAEVREIIVPRPAKQSRAWKGQKAASDAFLLSYEWRKLRMEVIRERGARCECCGAAPPQEGVVINVDHIKPRKLFPELALEKSNLQVLCGVCNHGKGNWDQTDWRESTKQDIAHREELVDRFRPIWRPAGKTIQ